MDAGQRFSPGAGIDVGRGFSPGRLLRVATRECARLAVRSMSPVLASLVALQSLDSAADTARKRLAELPASERAIEQQLSAARETVESVKAKQQENRQAHRTLEKDVALVDTRLARFDDHKAAVKTNQEYTALLHEIATAKAEKDAIEERILILMDAADGLAAELQAAEAALAETARQGGEARAGLVAERDTLEAELARLAAERTRSIAGVPAAIQAKYEQLIKQRRGIAVAAMNGETCSACHVRLRPHVTQVVRRNEEIVQCESCQRILYYPAPDAQSSTLTI
jgi:predicted  nucleic acid-binding Zn-ribbon protein